MYTYLRILTHGKPFLGLGLLAMVSILVYSVFNAASLLALIPFLEILFSKESMEMPTKALNWMDLDSLKDHGYYQLSKAMESYGKMQVLIYFCSFLMGSILIKNIARYSSAYFISPLEQGIIRSIRSQLFEHLTRLGLPYYVTRKKGNIIGIVVSDVQVVQDSVIKTVLSILREPITMITSLSFLFIISWRLTLFTLIVLPLTGLFINYIRKSLKRKARQGQIVLGELIAILDEFVSGIRIVKAFQKEAYEIERYEEKNKAYTDLQISLRRRAELSSPITELISVGVICCIIVYGGILILGENSSLTAPEFITFIGVFAQFMEPIKVFSNSISKVQRGIAAYERVESLLNEEPSIKEVAAPKSKAEFDTEIRFEDVSFRYDAEDVLKHVSFSLGKGQMMALVGPSGAGKSTLADLLPRFHDPSAGAIYLDGVDIRAMAIKDLRSLIGVVTQEGILFHDSVLNNIAYGISHKNREEVIQAAKIANAHEFIMELPEQYDTIIGERGTRLSGGQRQRISIARAILRNPPILILDEATSNLDNESERLVQEALDKLMANRTSIVIAHRLSTISNADQILVLERGILVEQGAHDALLQQGGLYRKLYDLQFSSPMS